MKNGEAEKRETARVMEKTPLFQRNNPPFLHSPTSELYLRRRKITPPGPQRPPPFNRNTPSLSQFQRTKGIKRYSK